MEKSNVYSSNTEIKCSICGKDLMEQPEMSLVNIIQNLDTNKIVSVKPCCKGKCDQIIEGTAKRRELSGWKDLTDFMNPYLYMQHIMSVMNSMQKAEGFENQDAYEEYKNLLLNMYPYITRNLSEEEKEEAIMSNAFPY